MADLLRSLNEKGYVGRIVSVSHLPDLREDIEANHRKGLYDEGLYRDYLSRFVYAPPDSLPHARSIIVVAGRQPSVRFIFNWKGKRVPAIVPASYLHVAEENAKAQEVLAGILARDGYKMAPVMLPKKLLATHSGLAAYGRNNITYIKGFGSFYLLHAFYSDIPCEDDWQAPAMAARCEDCRACVDHCPTGAIDGERFLIHVERCIAFYGEKPGNVPFPDWIDPAWHNCLFGCLRCQNICPENVEARKPPVAGEEFSSAETGLLLARTPVEQMPAPLVEKLKASDLIGLLDELPRNLRALLERKN